jgi:hypothetical protein
MAVFGEWSSVPLSNKLEGCNVNCFINLAYIFGCQPFCTVMRRVW